MSAVADDLVAVGIDQWLAEAVQRLARGDAEDLAGFFVAVDTSSVENATRATCRVHFLKLDGNGRPRLKPLAAMLARQVIDYCIPRSRIDEAAARFTATGSSDFFVRLQTEAKSLFTTLENSGEGGELLLFVLMERLLDAPQVLCKMSLKTNSQMHVHGADGVHIKLREGGGIAIYWCESKLYADFGSATSECFASIKPFLLDEGGGASALDLLLVRDHLDAGDGELSEKLRRFADDDAPDAALREIRGASLIGFDHDDYPNSESKDADVQASVRTMADGWVAKVLKRVSSEGLEEFSMEIFCLPLPAVADFRAALREELGIDP